jgi:hypothetical protein
MHSATLRARPLLEAALVGSVALGCGFAVLFPIDLKM